MDRNFFVFLIILILLTTGLFAAPVRNITTADGSFYFDESFNYSIEDVLIIPLVENFQLLARVTFIHSDSYIRTLLQPGAIFIFAPGIYMEFTYGAAISDSLKWVQEGYLELTIEQEKYILSSRLKFSYDHGVNEFFFLPDFSGAYQFSSLYGLKAKYFFSIDSYSTFHNALLLENRFSFSDSFGLDLLTTAGFHVADDSSVSPFEYEVGLRFRMAFTPNISLKVLTSYLGKVDTYGGLHAVLTLDIKFPKKEKETSE